MGTVKFPPVKDPLLFGLFRDYFTVYLPTQRGCSEHTIKSYRTSLNALLNFVKDRNDVEFAEVTFVMIDNKMLAAFLGGIDAGGGSIATRNLRLTAIRSFYAYAAATEPLAVAYYDEINKVPYKKSPQIKGIEYMSETAVAAILSQPDISTEKGLRDRFLMLLLYDTGARIQELTGVAIRDVQLGATPTVRFRGENTKSSKTRTVPLSEKTAAHFQNYLRVFHAGEPPYSAASLFYTYRRGVKKPIHHDTARKMMFGYGIAAKVICPEVPDNVHPHLWRHSRAMHLYQRGMDLTLISQWLGHANLETTLIYAHADTEHKRKAIEAAVSADSPVKSFTNAERYTVTDEETLKLLYGLR
jgi:site-specific recombinase XerD